MLYFLRAEYFANCHLEGYHHSCEWLLLAAPFVHQNLHVCEFILHANAVLLTKFVLIKFCKNQC